VTKAKSIAKKQEAKRRENPKRDEKESAQNIEKGLPTLNLQMEYTVLKKYKKKSIRGFSFIKAVCLVLLCKCLPLNN
jgi:hypothetical protein